MKKTLESRIRDKSPKNRKYNKVIERIIVLNKALKSGVKSIKVLCKRTNLSPHQLYQFSAKYDDISIPFDNMKPYRNAWPEIDILVKKGLEQKEIGDLVNFTGEYIRHHIKGSGQHKIWENAKRLAKEKDLKNLQKEKEQAHKSKVKGLYKMVYDNTEKYSWVRRKAIEYIKSYRSPERIRLDFKKVIKILKRYHAAKKSGKPKSLLELGDGIYLQAGSVEPIIKRAGLKSMYRTLERHQIPKHIREEMKELFFVNADPVRAAEYLEVPASNVRQNFYIWRKKYGMQSQNS